MLLHTNVKMAMDSIKSAKWRSFFTMLGIIIGVASVVTIVSLGEGVKQQVVGQVTQRGPDLITVRPGKLVNRDQSGKVQGYNLLAAMSGGVMSEKDLKTIQQTPGVRTAVPIGTVSGVARLDDRELSNGFVLATSEDMPKVLNQELEFGSFFSKHDTETNFAVIGKHVAEQLFQENVPIGRAFEIRDKTFIVNGVFEEFPASPLSSTFDYNAAVFIPMGIGRELNGGQTQIQQVLVKPHDPGKVNQTADALNTALTQSHGGRHDYSILRQEDNLAVVNQVVNLLTALISGIAAISLLVGGIGIMNVMLVSVSERTHEIGIRKAVGATDRQILTQFLIEASVISFVGGIIGVILSYVANYFIRLTTTLQPIITLEVIGIAVLAALVVGAIFGVTPAIRAAKKDPIQALRQI